MKLGKSIFKTFFVSLCIVANTAFAHAQTASILPPAKTTFVDQNGKPLTSGTVDFYVPGTTTRKTTWQDSAKTIPNTNPVVLDAAGRSLIWGDGAYRQIVKDRNGNLIWDQVTSSIGTGGSGVTVGDGDAVGTVKPWSGMTAPSQYQFAYGQALTRSLYPELLSFITIQTAITCTGGNATLTNISDTTSMSVGTAVESNCTPAGATIISKTSTTVTLSANATVSTTSTGVFYPYGNGDGSITFNVPDLRGVVLAGRTNMGGVTKTNLTSTYFSTNANNTPAGMYAIGGSQSHTQTVAEMAQHSHTATTTNSSSTFGLTFDSTKAVVDTTASCCGTSAGSSVVTAVGLSQNPSVTIPNGGINLSTNLTNTGTSNAFTLVQPTVTVNYIIKVTPDSASASFNGVQSLGGMSGVITCGSGLLCTGNDISVSSLLAGQALTRVNDTNVTLTLGGSPSSALVNATSLTLGWSGQLGLTRGGTNNTLTASNGGVVYSDASKLNILSGTVTAGQCLLSGSSAAPTWGSCAGGATVTSIAGNTGAFTLSHGITNSTNDIQVDQSWRGYVTSAQYGVTCDGVTDDHVNMQTFLTALGTNPYPLGIINGTTGGSVCYMGTTTLNIPAKSVIYGGTRQTTLKWASAVTTRMLQPASSPGSDSVTIKQLILDGTTKASQVGIYPYKVSGWHIEDVQINNVSNCIYADAGAVASNYHVILNVSCSSADTGISWVGISNSNAAYSFRCITVTTCITDNGNNNSSTNGRFEVVTTGTLLQTTSVGYSSINDRVENTPTSGSGFVTAGSASKATLVNPYFAGLTTNINDVANALINSPYEYRVKVTFNSVVNAQSSVDTLVTTGPMTNCRGDAEVTASADAGSLSSGLIVVGMYRNGTGPYYRVSNVTGANITPNTSIVLTCRQRS